MIRNVVQLNKRNTGGTDDSDDERMMTVANLKSQRVWLSASCLFNNNDGKLNVNTLREKGFICIETHLTALEICEQKKCQIFPFTKRRVVVVLLGR